MALFLKKVFPPYSSDFLAKNQKIFKVGKIIEYEETEHFEKKCFHRLKRHLFQNGKVENLPVVAGPLVFYFH